MIEILFFLTGLFIGSFLGVVVDRTYRKESIIKGRSHCDKCKKELGFYDLIPVLSFILSKGKCRYCKTKLPIFYPAIEITTGILFSLIFYFFKTESIINIVYYLVIVSSFIVIFFQDIKYGIIADKILVFATGVSLLFLFIFKNEAFLGNLMLGLASFLFFVSISVIFYLVTKKQGMGGGDIKLSFLLGLFLGFPSILVSLYLAFLTGAILSIILILWKKKKFLKDSLPFGPFLITGALISFFFGNLIYSKALNLLGF